MRKYIFLIISIVVVLLSATFRLGFINLADFGMDADGQTSNILDCVINSHFPPLITTSHGVPNIALIDIVLFAIISFMHDPRLIILLFNSIPNTLAVILIFLFCNKLFNKKIALLSTALFGFSSWAIFYSKGLWGVNNLQLISLLIFYILSIGIIRKNFWIIASSLAFLPFLPNLHLTSVSLAVSAFFILMFTYDKTKFKYFFYGSILIFCISLFVLFDMLQKKAGLDRNILATGFSLKALYTSMDLIVRNGWFYGFLGLEPEYPFIEKASALFIKIFFLIGCVHLLKKMVSDINKNFLSGYVITGIWFFTFMIFFGITNMTPFAHYFMVVLPALFIITALGFFAIIDTITGKEKIQSLELLVISSIFLTWNPLITSIIIFVFLIFKNFSINNLLKKYFVYILNIFIIFIICFYCFSHFKLFIEIEKTGGVPGRAFLELGSKIRTVKYILSDAKIKYTQTGILPSYSIENDAWFDYIFKYLSIENKFYLSTQRIPGGCNYKIINVLNEGIAQDEIKKYINPKHIGNLLIITENNI
jgi:hypothetical protein